jgi:hypothetical protein
MVLQPGDEGGEFTNQFREFLQKNTRLDEQPKKEKTKPKSKTRKVKKRSSSSLF